MTRKKRTGIYLTAGQILTNPDYVQVLRDEIGLNLAILSYSGELSQEVLDCSPFDAVPLSDQCLHSLLIRHLDGDPVDPLEFDNVRASVGPSVHAGGDEQTFRRALDALRATGVEVWMGASSWTHRRLMFCPSNEGVNAWFAALYTHLATQYEVDGLDITHARYPMGSFPRGLFSCTCDACAGEAEARGFAMDDMTFALREGLERLGTVDAGLLSKVSRSGAGLGDFLQVLGLAPGVLDWFGFRAELLEAKIGRFHRAVKAAAGEDFMFGCDTHPASLSLFVGHNHANWGAFSDFASPLVSHISAFVVDTLVVWAQFLQQVNGGLSEADALQIIYGLVGYDNMGLPETVAGYELDEPSRLAHILPLEDLIMRDLHKARLCLPASLPSYPIIHGSGWPRQAIDAIVQSSSAAGHDGIIWQGTDELVSYRTK